MPIPNSNTICFYHPVKTLFLDDNINFLNALALQFGDHQNIEMFTDPALALQVINENKQDLLQAIIDIDETENSDNKYHMSGLEISNTIAMIYDKSRFDNVAVLVVDYKMPDINGIEFCQKLSGKHLYKILLTAEADKDIAIAAFNRGDIDKFILKTSQNLFEDLAGAINELRDRYFRAMSQIIFQSCGESLRNLLDQNSYKELFNRVKLENHSAEYYLVDKKGSFLFLTKNAEPTWLLLSDEKTRKEQVDLLKGYDFPKELVQKIQNREDILFLFSKDEHQEPIKNWGNYMFPSQKLDDYYNYSIVKGRLTKSIQWEKITSFKHVY